MHHPYARPAISRPAQTYWVLTIILTIAACAVHISPASAQAPHATVLSHSQVYRSDKADPYDPTNDFGFNHAPSVTQLGDGRLLTAWFAGPFEASVHQVILGAYSSDNGQTWGEAAVLQDEPTRSDFDPAFISHGDQTLMFYSVGRWNRYPFVGLRDAEQREVGVDSYRLLARATHDSGATWAEGRRVLDETGWGCRSNGIVLANGDWVLPIYHFKPPYTASALISTDRGEHWTRHGEVRTPGEIGAAEPTIAAMPDGQVVMALRTYDGNLWLCRSNDNGRTWSEPSQTQMTATSSSHFLLNTTTGLLILIHNPSPPPARTSLSLRISSDAGASWGEPLEIDRVEPSKDEESFWSRQVCYPSAVELADGTVAVVWAKLDIGNRHQSGVIHAARVRIE